MSRHRGVPNSNSKTASRGTTYYCAVCPACRHEFLIEAPEFRKYAANGGCPCPTCNKVVPIKYFRSMIEVDRPIFKH